MKKLKLFLAVFIIFLFHHVQGQFGAQLGLNSSTLRVSLDGISSGSKSKIGAHLGLIYDLSLSPSFYIRPGILYSMKGGKDMENGSTLDFNYIEIPVDLIYYTNKSNDGFYLSGGPYFGYLLSVSEGGIDTKEQYKSTDLGINLGLGYKISKFSFGFKASFGVSSIYDTSLPILNIDISGRNRLYSIYGIYHL